MNLPVRHTHRYAAPTGLGMRPSATSSNPIALSDYYSNPLRGMHGVGSLGVTDQQITSVIGTAASAIPVVGPFIAAAASVAVAIETLFAGCGQTCTAATSIVNQVGNQISTAMHQYMSAPIHTESMQAAYLQLFDNAWALIQQNCGNPALGAAGQRCVTDRQAGACTWKSSPGGWNQDSQGNWIYTWAGAAGSGDACWNYFSGMRDPVANDPTVVPDIVAATGTAVVNSDGTTTVIPAGASGSNTDSTSTSASSASNTALLALGGAALLLFMAMEA